MGVMLLFSRIFPAPPPAQPPVPAAGAAADGKDQPNAEAAAADAKAKADEQPQDAAEQLAAKAGPLPAVAAADTPIQFVTLGSLDMNSDYRMLVTLTNAGAALHRAEMASSRFRDQQNWSGYLGELELKNVPGGVQVQVVGAGTPAANATVGGKPAPIQPGDVIVGIGDPQNGRRQERG